MGDRGSGVGMRGLLLLIALALVVALTARLTAARLRGGAHEAPVQPAAPGESSSEVRLLLVGATFHGSPDAPLVAAVFSPFSGSAQEGVIESTLGPQHAGPSNAAPRIIDDPAGGELVIEVGPVDLPPGAGTHAEGEEAAHSVHGDSGHAAPADSGPGGHDGVFPPVGTVRVPAAARLYGFSLDMVDGEGRQLPAELLHHINIIDPDHRELFLPISRRLLAMSKETAPQSLPRFLMGVPVQAGQRLVVATMLHNPTGTEYRDVQVRVRLKYTRPGRPWPLFAVYPFQIDVGFPAGDKSFDLPPGRSRRAFEVSPVIPGRLLAIGGHVHDHAVSITVEDLTTGKIIWQGQPVMDHLGRVVGMPVGRLYRALGVPLYPDHRYRVGVEYDNPFADTLRTGGMGVVGGVFAPARRVPWPAVDTTDALYRLDRMHYLRLVRGTYEEISVRR